MARNTDVGHPLMLGVIADDITGGADLAGMLTSCGVRTLLCPDQTAIPDHAGRDWDAIVMALKTRASAPAEAVAQSTAALAALRQRGARQIYFKYCSTFDSTDRGNIGPVLDALMDALAAPGCGLAPALPINGRTQYLGHLFVDGRLLSESPLRDHPRNPMRDPDLVRHLRPQTRHRVALASLPVVRRGPAALRQHLDALQAGGDRLILLDAIDDGDLRMIAEAVVDDPVISGGSGLALALPDVWRARQLWQPRALAGAAPTVDPSLTLIVCGSCSARTRDQIRALEQGAAGVLQVDVPRLTSSDDGIAAELARLSAAMQPQLASRGWSVVTSCSNGAAPGENEERATRIEALLGQVVSTAVGELGVRSLVLAGGETSGAAVRALGLSALRVGAQIDPGVPLCQSCTDDGAPRVDVILKSGNFGAVDLFSRALSLFGHSLDTSHS